MMIWGNLSRWQHLFPDSHCLSLCLNWYVYKSGNALVLISHLHLFFLHLDFATSLETSLMVDIIPMAEVLLRLVLWLGNFRRRGNGIHNPNSVITECLFSLQDKAWKRVLRPSESAPDNNYPCTSSILHTRDNLQKSINLRTSLECGRKPRKNSWDHRENLQTPHGQHPSSGSNSGLWRCKATTVLQCHCAVSERLLCIQIK